MTPNFGLKTKKKVKLSKLFPYAELENIKEIKELIPKKGEELICEKMIE